MAGHSHWARIKHQKAAVDAKKGRQFSKLIHHVISAAKRGGGDPNQNITLRECVERAKAASVPRDTIERAIKKATGEGGGPAIEASSYEGYGPGGVAILVDLLTDNKNRTIGELRRIFEERGAKPAQAGSVAWMFESKGLLTVKREAIPEDDLMALLLEAGGDNYTVQGDVYEIVCDPRLLHLIRQALRARKVEPEIADISRIPTSTVLVDEGTAKRIEDILEAVEGHDDVESVYTNAEFPDRTN